MALEGPLLDDDGLASGNKQIIIADATLVPEEEEEIGDHGGFTWYTPQSQHKEEGKELNWVISGHDMQVLTMTIPPGGQVISEPGTFLYMHPNMNTEVELTLCGTQACTTGCARLCGGASCATVQFSNNDEYEGHYLGFTPKFPAKVIPMDRIRPHSNMIAQQGSLMTFRGNDVRVGCHCNASLSCCSGLGLCRQKISHLDNENLIFLAGGGTILWKDLEGECMVTDGSMILAMEDSVKVGVRPAAGWLMCCFGGEGCCYTTVTGPGKIWLSSMPFWKYKAHIQITVNAEEMDRDE